MTRANIDELRTKTFTCLKAHSKPTAPAAGIQTIKESILVLFFAGINRHDIAVCVNRERSYISTIISQARRGAKLPISKHFNATISNPAYEHPSLRGRGRVLTQVRKGPDGDDDDKVVEDTAPISDEELDRLFALSTEALRDDAE